MRPCDRPSASGRDQRLEPRASAFSSDSSARTRSRASERRLGRDLDIAAHRNYGHAKRKLKKGENMGVIQASFGKLASGYPRRDQQDPALYQYVDQVMTGLAGTPCCVQMSHALNMAGIRVPTSSYRRPNARLKINVIITSSPSTNWRNF
jgi:hypothetical protein